VSGRELERAKRAWAHSYDGLSQDEVDRRVVGFTALVRGIAERGAVTAADFSRATALDPEKASEAFAGLATVGLERDAAGRIIGAALTTKPTPHSVRLEGRQLYAWCALDTLFIPGLAGKPAIIGSTCPTSGASIRLRVTPAGVESADPIDALVSVVLPGVGSSGAITGPASPT
jgi:alkylmercury lyase